ncbi:DUF3570 domain-containing protein [Caenimonas aquaedulcis]|uniref:DUF3570 domain-containing protein n=1 Tax=Caenimonas aquaedulcis TaxID=2793270 RepID=UPI00338ECFCE
MAATERGRVLAASLLLPGLAAVSAVRAEEPPEQATIALKYGWYRDAQPGWDRVRVHSPQVFLSLPFAGAWAVEGSAVVDSVSGATPRMHTTVSTATPYMSDVRRAADVKVTRYFHRAAISAGIAYSGENDYVSRAQSLEARWSSEDNNRTWTVGLGHSRDRIDASATGGSAIGEHRETHELLLGATQVLTARDLVQVQLTRSLDSGYYSDPYKLFDDRPGARRASIAFFRWNHFVDGPDATLRTSWRHWRDSFGIRASTLSAEWAQPVGAWTFTPGLRWHMQSAASFYFDPVVNASGIPDSLATRIYAGSLTGYRSADQRLAAFGAVTVSLKAAYDFGNGQVMDARVDVLRQAAHYKPGGGSPYLDPMRATFVQLGWSRKF